MTAASAPSARTHFTPGLSPDSLRSRASGTPVHSDVLVSPCVPCTVLRVGLLHSVRPLPEHSMNIVREIDGNRRMSAIEYFFGWSTMPCTTSEWRDASIVAIPP